MLSASWWESMPSDHLQVYKSIWTASVLFGEARHREDLVEITNLPDRMVRKIKADLVDRWNVPIVALPSGGYFLATDTDEGRIALKDHLRREEARARSIYKSRRALLRAFHLRYGSEPTQLLLDPCTASDGDETGCVVCGAELTGRQLRFCGDDHRMQWHGRTQTDVVPKEKE